MTCTFSPAVDLNWTLKLRNETQWGSFRDSFQFGKTNLACSFRAGLGKLRRPASASHVEADVVIVGAGVIGTATAHHILNTTSLSVALIDAKVPCSGATGAGRVFNVLSILPHVYTGYIWMAHRKPYSPGWFLAKHGKYMWQKFAEELELRGANPQESLGLRRTGSLLVASTDEQASSLEEWVKLQLEAGQAAKFLTPSEALELEPPLASASITGGALFSEDFQIDALRTMTNLLQGLRNFEGAGRYKELFHSPVQQIIRSKVDRSVVGVELPTKKVFSREAVVIACGAWSSGLMDKASKQWAEHLVPRVKPRKGHMLVVEGVHDIQLKSGLMEVDYLANYHKRPPEESQKSELGGAPGVSISMTATLDPSGNLLIGSSREFAGFNTDAELEVMEQIMHRAARFLPAISNLKGTARIGLRPYAQDGRPLIGPVEDVPGLIFATGHEGSGLCLALATAEMVTNMIMGKANCVDPSPFLPSGRLASTLDSVV